MSATELPAISVRTEQFSRLEQLGTRLSGLRLCLPTAVRALRESLEQRGQLLCW